MGALNQFRGLPKQVYLLSFVRVLMALGALVFSFISLLMTDVLGFNEFQSGLIMIVIAAATIVGSFSGGKLGDKYGRKKVLLLASVLAMVFAAVAGWLTPTIGMLPCLLLSFFFSSLVQPVVAAMITDSSDDTNRAECFSILYLTQNMGYAIGPSIGGFLYYNNLPWIFYGEAIMYGVAIVAAALLIHDDYHIPAKEECQIHKLTDQNVGTENASTLGLLLKMPVLLGFIICLALLTSCYAEIGFALPMQFEQMCGKEIGSRYTGLIWAVNGSTIILGTPLLISLTKKRNQLKNIVAAGFLYALGFGLNGYIDWPIGILMVVVVWTAGEILISTGAGVFIAGYAPPTHIGRFQSLYEVARGLGRGLGPTVAGYYLLTHNYRQMWTMVAVVCIVVTGFVYVLYRMQKKELREKRAAEIAA